VDLDLNIFGRAIRAVDGNQVLRAAGEDHDAVPLGAQSQKVARFGLGRPIFQIAIVDHHRVHEEVPRRRDHGRDDVELAERGEEIVSAVRVVLLGLWLVIRVSPGLKNSR
jgi:hypothetical protein